MRMIFNFAYRTSNAYVKFLLGIHFEITDNIRVTMYDFKDLSPIDFEDLVRDLLQKNLKLKWKALSQEEISE